MWRCALLSLLLLGASCKREPPEDGSRPLPSPGVAAVSPPVAAPAPEPEPRPAPDLGGLPRIKERGTLRVLVPGGEESFLARAGIPGLQDAEMASAFARSLDVEPVLVPVESHEALIPMLVEGHGDLIAAPLTITEARSAQVDFIRSTRAVSEVLVGKKGAPGLPRTLEALDGREVHVRASSSYAETLAALQAKTLPKLRIVHAPERDDAEALVYAVSRGERPLTVVDDLLLEAIEAYNPDVERLFPVATQRKIAWAVRKENPELGAALDAFVVARAMTQHREAIARGDLAEIQRRRVLRVLTRNNPVTYFLYKGRQHGFEYELASMLAEDLGVRLEMVVAPERKDLIPWLLEGRGDVIAASLTVTEGRGERVAFSQPYLFTREVVVKKRGAPGPTRLEELAGQTVHVRRSSSYAARLQALRAAGTKLELIFVPEHVETPELLHQVAAGEIGLTVADQHLVEVEQTYGADVEVAFGLGGEEEPDQPLAFAVRPQDRALRARIDAFVKREYRGLRYNMAKKRYFENPRTTAVFREQRTGSTGRISPYDEVIQKYAKKYDLDWRLLSAQAQVESGFNPEAKSWVGALGLFQVMPNTGASLGFHDLADVEQGTHAGVKYLAQLIERFDPSLDFRQRVRFALAAYNAGLGHVIDARRLAAEKGLDPNRWFGNVEQAMLLLAKPEYARRARHGYCRGGEPVAYVSKIQTFYDAYLTAAPATKAKAPATNAKAPARRAGAPAAAPH